MAPQEPAINLILSIPEAQSLLMLINFANQHRGLEVAEACVGFKRRIETAVQVQAAAQQQARASAAPMPPPPNPATPPPPPAEETRQQRRRRGQTH